MRRQPRWLAVFQPERGGEAACIAAADLAECLEEIFTPAPTLQVPRRPTAQRVVRPAGLIGLQKEQGLSKWESCDLR
jgi:hypothetical protein